MKWGPLRRGPHTPRGLRRSEFGFAREAVAASLFALVGCAVSDAAAPAFDVTVKTVVDGDTLRVNGLPEGSGLVRLIGINAPETGAGRTTRECFGPEARRWLADRVAAGSRIRLVPDVGERDRFGRRLAYAYAADGGFLNAELVANGFATTMTIRPNTRHAKELHDLERQARAQGRGFWSACPAEASAHRR
jgi:micrococcal nuclease